MDELKPCPFCGGEAKLTREPDNGGVGFPSYDDITCQQCGVFIEDKGSPQRLIDRWNRCTEAKAGGEAIALDAIRKAYSDASNGYLLEHQHDGMSKTAMHDARFDAGMLAIYALQLPAPQSTVVPVVGAQQGTSRGFDIIMEGLREAKEYIDADLETAANRTSVPSWEKLMDIYHDAIFVPIESVGKELDRFRGWKAIHAHLLANARESLDISQVFESLAGEKARVTITYEKGHAFLEFDEDCANFEARAPKEFRGTSVLEVIEALATVGKEG